MSQSEEPVLNVEHLSVNFRTEEGLVQAVRDVSFRMKRGKVLAIVGESGSGKSVTAFSILRLIQSPGSIDEGTITLNPKDGNPIEITSLPEKSDLLYHVRGGLVSMIFQEPMSALSPVHTVGNQICEAILLHQDKTKAEAEAFAIEMLGKVGIPQPEDRIRQYPHELSGGMRQRVVIAMALVCRPELLICDEPTTALDVTIQAQILDLIRSLQEEMGTSVLFITHDIGVVAQIADDVAVMYKGRIVERGTVREVLKTPLHPYTKGLLSAIPGLNEGKRRLPTISSVIAETGVDLSREYPLTVLQGDRMVALPEEEIQKLKVL
jgi:ABC-type dipeptide/oligopeptide/nickel transport system ATPase component